MYKIVVFDVDGTLIDTEKSIILGLKKLLTEKNKRIYTDEELDFVLGIPAEAAIERFEFNEPEKCMKKWSDNMEKFKEFDVIFPQIIEALKCLKSRGVITGIVTSRTKAEYDTDPIFLSIKKYFDHIICADDTKLHKPNGEPLIKFLANMKAKSSDAVFIGDTIYDCKCAENAGVDFLWAGWGTKENINYESKNVIISPDKIIDYI